MTRGRELPVNSKVRRRLFIEDDLPVTCARCDANQRVDKVIKTEYIARTLNNELILKGMRWNFDFELERAMRGHMQWYRKGSSNKWVKMEQTGTTIFLRKRSRADDSKFTCEEERPKVRRLSPHTVALRQGFFTEGRELKMILNQAQSENSTNNFRDNLPEYSSSISSGIDSTEDEEESSESSESTEDQDDEEKDEAETNEEKEDEASNNIEDKDGVETDVVVNTNYQRTTADMIEMEKDANDNQEPLISEDKFEKLHIEDNDNTDITKEDEEKPNDMKNLNEATPKNEKKAIAEQNNGEPLRARNDKAKKKLDDSFY